MLPEGRLAVICSCRLVSRRCVFVEMELRTGNWSKGQCNAYLCSLGLNKALSKTVYDIAKHNAVCANDDIKCPISKSWQTDVSLDMFIEAPMHLLSFWDSQKHHGDQ